MIHNQVTAFVSHCPVIDDAMVARLRAQASRPDSPIAITGASGDIAPGPDRDTRVRDAIRRAQLLICVLGPISHAVSDVGHETHLARQLSVPVLALMEDSGDGIDESIHFDHWIVWTWDSLARAAREVSAPA
jgi:hypothetical protein